MTDASRDELVYVAYAREDLARVEPIVAALREGGIRLVFDAGAAPGAGDYVSASQQALRTASALIVFVSAASVRSHWVESEVRRFQSLMTTDLLRQVIVVQLDSTPLPIALAHVGAIDGVDTSAKEIAASVASRLYVHLSLLLQLGLIATTYVNPLPDVVSPDAAFEAWGGEAPAAKRESAPPLPSLPGSPAGVSLPPPYAPPPPAPAPAPYAPPSSPFAPPPQPSAGPITGSLGGVPQAAGQPGTSGTALEQVTFTAYHPREMAPQQWQPLIFYISVDSPAVLAQVASAAAERLAGRLDKFRAGRSERSAALARGAKLRLIPSAPGCQFNPSQLDVTWQEDVQQHEFRMRADAAKPGQSVNGVVQVYQGLLLRAEVPISIYIGQAVARLDSPDAYAQAIARAYRRIFASYSHGDTAVVESCESAARTMGDQYLRDVSLLQSGVEWDPRLIQAINDADIFQLFWSKRAAQSPFVAREWQHALKLLPSRPNFIRPVYWTPTLYPTPTELHTLHFQPLSLSSLGWGSLRRMAYSLRNR